MNQQPNFEQLINQGMNSGAPGSAEVGVAIGIVIVVFLVFLLIGLAIQAVICVFLSKPLKVVPEQYRLISPGMVWLLMIPVFSLIWAFFVYPPVSKSLKKLADAQGDRTVGDCGETIGWVYCGLCVAAVIPYLGVLCGIAAIVLVILYLVKVNTIANQLNLTQMQTPTTATVLPPNPSQGNF